MSKPFDVWQKMVRPLGWLSALVILVATFSSPAVSASSASNGVPHAHLVVAPSLASQRHSQNQHATRHHEPKVSVPGYWLVTRAGVVEHFGDAHFYGSASPKSGPIVALAATANGRGYWLVTRAGVVEHFGDAHFYGSASPKSGPIVALAATPNGRGYWLVTRAGVVEHFGDAHFYGSASPKSGPIVALAATANGRGYWLVTRAGVVEHFGDAHFYGSASPKSGPIAALAATPNGRGYWLVTRAGVVEHFGDAHFYGSASPKSGPIVALAATPNGRGYWLVTRAGVVEHFGDAHFYGSASPKSGPIAALAATRVSKRMTPLIVLTSKLTPAVVGSSYHSTLVASGGVAPYVWSILAGQLPRGLSLNRATGVIAGTARTTAVVPLTIGVSDRQGARATVQVTLIVGQERKAPPGEGSLSISVGQLPPGLAAAVQIKGPGGFSQAITGSTEMSVATGAYNVSASPVDNGAVTYYPTVTGETLTVSAGELSLAGVSYLTEVSDLTKVVPSTQLSDLQSMTPDQSSFVFSPPPPALVGVQPGDVIVAGPSTVAPQGFLRRVTSASSLNGELIVATSPATLTDAVPRGSFDANWPTSPVSAQQARHLLPRVTGSSIHTSGPSIPQDSSSPSTLPSQFTIGGSGAPACGVTGTFTPGPAGTFFSITPHLDANWNFPTRVQADAYIEIQEGISTAANVPNGLVCQQTVKLWGPDTFGIPDLNFSIGPVPVNISILMELDLTLKVQSSTSLTIPTETQGFDLQVGVSYDSQASPQFQPIDKYTPLNSYKAPPAASGYFKASVGPKVTFAFYCYDVCQHAGIIIGPQVGLDGFVKVQFAGSHPDWGVQVGLEASVGFNVSTPIFSVNAQVSIPIYTATVATEAPVITTTSLPQDETGTSSGYQYQLQAEGFDSQPSYWGLPPSSVANPAPWADGTGGTGLTWYTQPCSLLGSNGIPVSVPGVPSSNSPVQVSSSGLLTISSLPASVANTSINLTVSAMDVLKQCTTANIVIQVLPGPTAQTYPLADPEIGVPYVNLLQLALWGLYNPMQGGTPPYTCAPSQFAYNVGLIITPNCNIRGTPSANVDPTALTGMTQQMDVADSFNPPHTAIDTLELGPVAFHVSACGFNYVQGQTCAQLQTQQPTTVTAEDGVPFSASLTASQGFGPYKWGPGTSCDIVDNGVLPPGLGLSSDGVLSGTPQPPYLPMTKTIDYNIPAWVVDQATGCAQTTLHLLVAPAPSITSTTVANAETGALYDSGPMQVSGGTAPFTWTVPEVTDAEGNQVTLPAGLSVNSSNGDISGTPLASDEGSYVLHFLVDDGAGKQASALVRLTIAPPLTITSPVQLAPCTIGEPYSFSLKATGGVGPYNWVYLTESADPHHELPNGLKVSSNGTISGTPTAGAVSATVQIFVNDQGSGATSATFVIPVGVAITTQSIPEAENGQPYHAFLHAAGGSRLYAWSTSPRPASLPHGIRLSPAGVLAGIPQTSTGTYKVSITVTDQRLGGSWTSVFQLKVVGAPSVDAALLPGDVGASYTSALESKGGLAPFTWRLVAGTLPSGLHLDTTGSVTGVAGEIYGTTNDVGTFPLTFRVVDAGKISAEGSTNLTITSDPVVTTNSLAPASAGVSYHEQLEASGGLTTEAWPYHWTLAPGYHLPDGLSLSVDGSIDGVAAASQVGVKATLVVVATDYWGVSARATLILSVVQPLVLTTPTMPEGEVGVPYWIQMGATGGRPWTTGYRWMPNGALPAGLNITDDTVQGVPSQVGDNGSFKLCASDSAGNSACTSPGLEVVTHVTLPAGGQLIADAGRRFSFALQANGGQPSAALAQLTGTPGYVWSLPASGTASGYPLPTWLQLSAGGLLSGTAPASEAGTTFKIPIQVGDSLGGTASGTVSLLILKPPPPPPSATNLTVTAMSAPSSSTPGSSINVSWTVKNVGGTAASGNWSDAVYLSTSPTATTTLLNTFAENAHNGLAPGATYSDNQNVTIPSNTTTGAYYLVVVTDTGQTITESSYSDDTSATSLQVGASVPAVTLVSPNTGSSSGGTNVTITGTGFTGVTAVDFGTVAQPATSFTFVNDTTITAVSPAGSSTVDIRVITPNGTSAIVYADSFTYL